MTGTNGVPIEDGARANEAPWQVATRGRQGTGRGRSGGRGRGEGRGGRGETSRETIKNNITNEETKESTVNPPSAAKTSNEQDGNEAPMDVETLNTQKKRSHSISEEKEPTQKDGNQDKHQTEVNKATQETAVNKATQQSEVELDYSDQAAKPTGKYAHLSKDEVKAMMKARGENMIEETGEMETQMKIEFNIGNNITKYSVRQNAVKVLEKMKAIDATFSVKSVHDSTVWKDMNTLPINDEFGTHFNVREETSPRGPKKIVMHCKMISKKKIGDIKFDANLIHFLRENKIWLVVDKFDMRRLGSPGFFIDMHPRLTNLTNLHEKLCLVMKRTQLKDKSIMDEWKAKNPPKPANDLESMVGCYNPIPDFHIQSGRRAFGAGEIRVQTDCLVVQSAAEDATYLKALLSSVYENQAFTKGMFVPAGIHLIESPTILCSLLRRHNKFLQETTAVTLFGMSTDSLDSPVTLDSGEVLDLKEFIMQYGPGITGIEETNKTESDGKWFIMTKKSKASAVTDFLDKHLKEIFDQFVNDEDLLPGFPYPRRAPANTSRGFRPASSTVGTYASVLRAYSSNPQEDGESGNTDKQYNQAPERPRKRQAVQILFDNNKDFPAIQETTTQQAPSVTPTPTTMSQTTNVDQKLADMEKRIQAQIQTMTAHQEAQMKHILSQFESNVQHIMEGMQAMMANVHQLANLPPPATIVLPKDTPETSPHAGSTVNNSMSSLAAQVNNSLADVARH